MDFMYVVNKQINSPKDAKRQKEVCEKSKNNFEQKMKIFMENMFNQNKSYAVYKNM